MGTRVLPGTHAGRGAQGPEGHRPGRRAAGRKLRFDDARLQAIWAITELPEDVRRGLIRFAEGYLADQGERRAG